MRTHEFVQSNECEGHPARRPAPDHAAGGVAVIGAALHLLGRAVDRLGDALEPPAMGNLRVTLAALSARVAAAEGEAARLRAELANAHRACGHALTVEAAATAEAVMGRGAAQAEAESLRCECDELRAEVERLRAELAGLRQTDHDVRTWCEQAADAMDAAYAAGFRYGVDHPGEAFRDACDLGVFLDDQRLRVEWAHGRQDEAAARRLGEDTRAMADAGVQGPSLTDPALVIARLLDERDAARDTVSELSYKLDNAGHEWFEAEKERDAARAEVERLTQERDAARGDRDETWRQIDRVAKERDAAQDTVSELSCKLDAAGHEWFETEKERDAARADLATLRAAVRMFKAAEDAYFEAEGNVAILGADNAMCAAKADMFAALPTQAADG